MHLELRQKMPEKKESRNYSTNFSGKVFLSDIFHDNLISPQKNFETIFS
jgi:hypothetical protein